MTTLILVQNLLRTDKHLWQRIEIMALSEELKQICRNFFRDLNLFYKKIKQYPLISLLFIIAVVLIVVLPHLQVSGINNVTEKVTQENQSRATLAQVLGGIAIGIGLYYTWRRINIAEEDLKVTQENLKVAQDNLKVTQENLEVTQKNAQDNLKVAQEGQITERFTRDVEQLGNDKLEIRLGGIYALERIANESYKDYWPIMEILTAYVRKNSRYEDRLEIHSSKVKSISMDIESNESTKKEDPQLKFIPLDIQAIVTVIRRRKYQFNSGELNRLDLPMTYLHNANFVGAHLENASLWGSNLGSGLLWKANISQADLGNTNLKWADLREANLKEASLSGADLSGANLSEANLSEANLSRANLQKTNLQKAELRGARYLSLDQLSKVKTLYDAELDDQLRIPLEKEYPNLFEEPKR